MKKIFENFDRESIPEKLTDKEAMEIVNNIHDNRLTLDKNHSEYFNILINDKTNRSAKILKRKFVLLENKDIVKIEDYLRQVLSEIDK
ncbi:hypothetical protein ISS06_00450 [Patescibacteria group bacterium]|nr:hypothetical protein [Patescibacteria group bacterium]